MRAEHYSILVGRTERSGTWKNIDASIFGPHLYVQSLLLRVTSLLRPISRFSSTIVLLWDALIYFRILLFLRCGTHTKNLPGAELQPWDLREKLLTLR